MQPLSRRSPQPLILGAHLSIAGGLHLALHRAVELDCTALQIFTRNASQWRAKPLSAEAVTEFRRTREEVGPIAVAAHASYLINLGSPDRRLRDRSIRSLVQELKRCEALGIEHLVLHPGAHMGAGEERGLRRIASALRRAHARTSGFEVKTVLENTAGQGTGLGHRFEQLARIIDDVDAPDRLRICFDTAHAFAAGYDFRTPRGYAAFWEDVDRLIGLENLAIFHLNDSRRDVGSRVDRHAHIGRGKIGREAFGRLMRDRRFGRVPKVLETPKEGDMDRRNLALLRRLAR